MSPFCLKNHKYNAYPLKNLCRELRSLGHKGLVLGVTGNVLPSDVEHFMAHGANRVIPKPLKADMLKKIVEGVYVDFMSVRVVDIILL